MNIHDIMNAQSKALAQAAKAASDRGWAALNQMGLCGDGGGGADNPYWASDEQRDRWHRWESSARAEQAMQAAQDRANAGGGAGSMRNRIHNGVTQIAGDDVMRMTISHPSPALTSKRPVYAIAISRRGNDPWTLFINGAEVYSYSSKEAAQRKLSQILNAEPGQIVDFREDVDPTEADGGGWFTHDPGKPRFVHDWGKVEPVKVDPCGRIRLSEPGGFDTESLRRRSQAREIQAWEAAQRHGAIWANATSNDAISPTDPRATAWHRLTEDVASLSIRSRSLFWRELYALVEREYAPAPDADRTAWAIMHATPTMVEAAWAAVTE